MALYIGNRNITRYQTPSGSIDLSGYYTGMDNYDPNKYQYFFGTPNDVDLSDIYNASHGLRDNEKISGLTTDPNDYKNANARAQKYLTEYQRNPENRNKDLNNWLTNYFNGKEVTEEELNNAIKQYNSNIDNIYSFQSQVGNQQGIFTNSPYVKQNTQVGDFYDMHNSMYGIMNTKDADHQYLGHDDTFKNDYGSTMSLRVADKTNDSQGLIKYENLDPKFANYNFVKLPSGHIGYSKTDATNTTANDTTSDTKPEIEVGSTDVNENVGPGNTNINGNAGPGNTKINSNAGVRQTFPTNNSGAGDISKLRQTKNILPEVLEGSKFIRNLRLNRQLYNMGKKAPTMQYTPNEFHVYQRGNLNAIRNAEQQRNQGVALARRAGTTDWQNYVGSQIAANAQGDSQVAQANALNDQQLETTGRQAMQQAMQNQQSRYATSNKNKENLYQTRMQRLYDKGVLKRMNHESWNDLLSSLKYQTELKRNERKQIQQAIDMQNYMYTIYEDLGKYGIGNGEDDQNLLNNYLADKDSYTNLTDQQKLRLNTLLEEVQTKAQNMYYAAQGYNIKNLKRNKIYNYDDINPVKPKETPASFKTGGTITGDSKIEIEKIREKYKSMQLFQKHIEKRIDTLEKDLTRTQNAVSQFVRGQIYTKKASL